MIELNLSAQKTLDQYLRQVHAYLRGSASVDAVDVEQSIHEHVETELAHASGPVTAEQLTDVLKRLGSPRQWVPEEELPWWRRVVLHWQVGPDDWRLAYMSFALLFIGFLGVLSATPICVFVLASVLLSRAALSATSDFEVSRGQKWLLYPGLLTVYVPLVLLIACWPPGVLIPIAVEIEHYSSLHNAWTSRFDPPVGSYQYVLIVTAIVTGITALWWTVLGLGTLIKPQWVKTIFHPFAESLSRGRIGSFLVLTFMIFVLSAGVMWYYLAAPY